MAAIAFRATKPLSLPINGAATYSANGSFSIPMDSLDRISRVRGGEAHTYVRRVVLIFRVNYADSGGGVTLEESKSFDFLTSLRLISPNLGDPIILESNAGATLHELERLQSGRRARGGDVSIGAASNTTATRIVTINFAQPLAVEPDDFSIPVKLFQDARIEGTWCDGTAGVTFGANCSLGSSSLVSAFAVLVEKSGPLTVPPPLRVRSFEAPGADSRLPIENAYIHLLAEVPVHAGATLVSNVITDTERTTVSLSADGINYLDAVSVAYLVEQWNQGCAKSRDEEITEAYADTAAAVPIFCPDQAPYKLSETLYVASAPRLIANGSDTTPRLVYVASMAHDEAEAARTLRAAGAMGGVPVAKTRGGLARGNGAQHPFPVQARGMARGRRR